MPLKKKGNKKGLGSAKSPTSEFESVPDPTTLVTGTQTDNLAGLADGNKKKKKKKKLSKSEKLVAKLDKEVDAIKSSGEPFQKFMDRMDRWMAQNAHKAIDLFRKFDVDGDGVLSYDEFKAGMCDLGAPVGKTELHLLAKLLDQDQNEVIDYLEFSKGLSAVREKETLKQEDVRPPLVITEKSTGRWDGESYRPKYPRYIQILFRFITFDNFKTHPFHFDSIVPTHINVQNLMQLIQQEVDISTTQLAIFTDKTRSPASMLPVEADLEELGFEGGSRDNPRELLLYYDYKVEFMDCPLLMCDYYFGQNLKV